MRGFMDKAKVKAIEISLNMHLERARQLGIFPKPNILGITQLFCCTDTRFVNAWKKRNSLRLSNS